MPESDRSADGLHADLTQQIIACAIEVHRELGPGLLESTYEACLCFELAERSVPFQRQVPLPVLYKGMLIDCDYRLDLLVANRVIVEIKSADKLHPVFTAQLLTYLKLSEKRVGLLINFNVKLVKDGLARVVC
ncbi:MAG: GxxExxY protein [Phycisphaerales bacterium]|nr:GxxExxY protein [Phycisphaerales bacterium]